MSIDAIFKLYVNKLGVERVAEIVGKDIKTVENYLKTTASKVAIDAVLAYDEGKILADAVSITPSIPESAPESALDLARLEKEKVSILMVTNRALHPAVVESLIGQFDRRYMTLRIKSATYIHEGRNALAHAFLQSGAEWSFWMDDDMILQHGNAERFKLLTGQPGYPANFAALDTLGRLLYHNKTIVAGNYVSKSPERIPQSSTGVYSKVNAQGLKLRPDASTVVASWAGTGCLLVNRKVYADIIRTQGREIEAPVEIQNHFGYRYGFFNPLYPSGSGEDSAFGIRAAKAGHQTYIDRAVTPGHIGWYSYNPHTVQ